MQLQISSFSRKTHIPTNKNAYRHNGSVINLITGWLRVGKIMNWSKKIH